MVNATKQKEKVSLLTRMAALYNYFDSKGDQEQTEKSEQLARKLYAEEYAVAFCGHFSAGKSSMINRLVGEDILPSSPIPTSANLVKVKSGEDYAKVYFHLEQPHLYPAPYNYEEVKAYCKDGDQIQTIEISYSESVLPEGAVIMDTPGIDSTDDAHRIATESALHLADIVFYVMDYNHVQSELNFLFTKELIDSGKELYLIVNQIDKHRKEELSFASFQESVKDSFASWGVNPKRIFYTTLKELTHPENQFSELQQFIQEKISKRKTLLPASVTASASKLTIEHLQYIEAKNDSLRLEQEQLLKGLSEAEQANLTDKYEQLQEQLSASKQQVENIIKQLDETTEDILKNAYLMPFQNRELAESYLRTHEEGFKVGLFFSKQKTAAERENRLNAFYDALQQTVQAQLDWHLKEHAQKTLKEQQLNDPALIQLAQSVAVTFEANLLRNAVKTGARLSGDYVLNYTNDVANELKRLARQALYPFKKKLQQAVQKKISQEQQDVTAKLEQLSSWIKATQKLANLKKEVMTAKREMEQLLTSNLSEKEYTRVVETFIEKWQSEKVIIREHDASAASLYNKEETRKQQMNTAPTAVQVEDHVQVEKVLPQTVKQLQLVANEVKDIPGFTHIADDLLERAERLDNRGFTVALFGAFSAGKSSFANALIGEKLLPVSPNPTTATINKILPVDKEHPHGTAKVKLKSATDLLADVNNSLQAFQLEAATLEEALRQIEKLLKHEEQHDSKIKIHYAFLAAFYRGFPAYRTQLDETIAVDIEQFQEFVALEEKSCLVEWIEIYVDCELTRKGITLVDTPGADSINARHTGVAFDYIKNSDATFFVTYYNHAFSIADREFLIQLGRVKDTFEVDKMFFIINAIDLANSPEEVEFVKNYVEEQLLEYGIRHPNISTVSSLLALQEKQTAGEQDESQLKQFEQKFYHFLDTELLHMAVTSAKLELNRVNDRLQQLIASAHADEEIKVEKRTAITKEKSMVQPMVEQQAPSLLNNQMTQEADELIYYIHQRVFLRFNDFFREAVNPSVLKDDGRNLKQTLNMAINEFLKTIGFDFAQEMRATTLRLEAFLRKTFTDFETSFAKQLKEDVNMDISFSRYEITDIQGIEFDNAFAELEAEDFEKALTYFKNPKTFFERNDRQLMGEAIKEQLQSSAEEYLRFQGERLKTHYQEMIETKFSEWRQHVWQQLEEFYEGLLAVYSDDFQVDQLEKVATIVEKAMDTKKRER